MEARGTARQREPRMASGGRRGTANVSGFGTADERRWTQIGRNGETLEPVRGHVADSVAASESEHPKGRALRGVPVLPCGGQRPRRAVTCRDVPWSPASRLAEGGRGVGGRAGGAGAPKGRTAEPAPTRRPTEGPCEAPAGALFAVLSLAPRESTNSAEEESRRHTSILQVERKSGPSNREMLLSCNVEPVRRHVADSPSGAESEHPKGRALRGVPVLACGAARPSVRRRTGRRRPAISIHGRRRRTEDP
jgi:hypothetical protein